MLPRKMKNALFDTLSNLPMRYVHAVPSSEAEGLVAEVYEQVVEDFFHQRCHYLPVDRSPSDDGDVVWRP